MPYHLFGQVGTSTNIGNLSIVAYHYIDSYCIRHIFSVKTPYYTPRSTRRQNLKFEFARACRRERKKIFRSVTEEKKIRKNFNFRGGHRPNHPSKTSITSSGTSLFSVVYPFQLIRSLVSVFPFFSWTDPLLTHYFTYFTFTSPYLTILLLIVNKNN